MQDKHQERAKAWRKMRKAYEQKRALLWGEDHEQKYKDHKRDKDNYLNTRGVTEPYVSEDSAFETLRKEFQVIKTAQFRKQFKEDYPEFESQIAGNEYYEKMAREDIKRVIRSFYRIEPGKARFEGCVHWSQEYTNEMHARIDLTVGCFLLVGAVSIYDLYKTCIQQKAPSLILNFMAGSAIAYTKYRCDQPNPNNWVPNLCDYINRWGDHTLSYPNYKTRNENETNQERSC